jgi:hypothetical protein
MKPVSLPYAQFDDNVYENTKIQDRISACMIQTLERFFDRISQRF